MLWPCIFQGILHLNISIAVFFQIHIQLQAGSNGVFRLPLFAAPIHGNRGMIAVVPIGGLIILFSVQPPDIKGGCAGFLRLDGLAGDSFVLGSAARVRKGCILSDEPLFTISDRQDYWEGVIREAPYPYAVCVPVRPETAPADAVTLPECRALSVLYCGDYTGVDEAWLTLGREAKARKLTPAAPPRILGIIAPYTGREIETRHYCSRIVLPVRE